MAGGHGDLEFMPDGTIWKPTNETELEFYLSVFYQLVEGVEGGLWIIKPGLEPLQEFIPHFHGHKMQGGVPMIRIANLSDGIRNPKIMDVKIGSRTASKKELKHTGMSTFGAWKKRRKLQIADWWTKSSARGYRVVDAEGVIGSRSEVARQETSDVFITFFDGDSRRLKSASDGVLRLARAMLRMNNIFISSSVLFCYDPRNTTGEVRLVLIDFGHTHVRTAVPGLNAAKYTEMFKAGLTALSQDLGRAQQVVEQYTAQRELIAANRRQGDRRPVQTHRIGDFPLS